MQSKTFEIYRQLSCVMEFEIMIVKLFSRPLNLGTFITACSSLTFSSLQQDVIHSGTMAYTDAQKLIMHRIFLSYDCHSCAMRGLVWTCAQSLDGVAVLPLVWRCRWNTMPQYGMVLAVKTSACSSVYIFWLKPTSWCADNGMNLTGYFECATNLATSLCTMTDNMQWAHSCSCVIPIICTCKMKHCNMIKFN